jgi:pyruvate/2-oxoglutarate dehydrogenase complex dihydrolipoamide acyltransferase (E2) component
MASFDGMAFADELAVTAPMAGVVVSIERGPHEEVGAGMPVVVLESMKMEHEVLADGPGVVRSVEVAVGDAVQEGQLLAVLTPSANELGGGASAGGAPRGRTSRSCSTRRRSWSTAP